MRAKTPYKKKRKRLGRGIGSGHGKTATRGHKGQRSRSGVSFSAGFEGGQNPLYRRLPKRGFNHERFKRSFTVVNLSRLSELGWDEISPEVLQAKGLMKHKAEGLKILGDGEPKKGLTVKAHRFSASAKQKIEEAGGKAVVISSIQDKST